MNTPIEELIESLDYLERPNITKESLRETLVKYLEKEKQVIIEAYTNGYEVGVMQDKVTTGEQYYKETFKNK